MGFIKAAVSAIGGSVADQWLDFYTVPSWVKPTAALVRAVPNERNRGRGADTKGSDAIITNGSHILVPEGYGLVTFEAGGITGLVTEAGAYTWTSDDQNSKSVFDGDGIISSTLKTSMQRFKFGGIPGTQQLAFFVNLKELPNNRFGTQAPVYFDDKYLNSQIGLTTRGTYTMKIVDPVLFVKNFVPATYLTPASPPFDFTDMKNDYAAQLFDEVVGSLAGAFSSYSNDPANDNRITKIQSDAIGFAKHMSAQVEEDYQWKTGRGLEIVKATLMAIQYDESTLELLKKVQQADALLGARGNSNLQASVAEGIQEAGQHGAEGLFGIGMATGGIGGLAGMQQPAAAAPVAEPSPAPVAVEEDPYAKLTKLKGLMDAGVISQADFDAAKAKLLGL